MKNILLLVVVTSHLSCLTMNWDQQKAAQQRQRDEQFRRQQQDRRHDAVRDAKTAMDKGMHVSVTTISHLSIADSLTAMHHNNKQ